MQYRGYRAVNIGIELLKFINKVITIQLKSISHYCDAQKKRLPLNKESLIPIHYIIVLPGNKSYKTFDLSIHHSLLQLVHLLAQYPVRLPGFQCWSPV